METADLSNLNEFKTKYLADEDVQVRLRAVRKLISHSKVLGCDRTCEEIIPILEEQERKDEEAVLNLISNEIENTILSLLNKEDLSYFVLAILQDLLLFELDEDTPFQQRSVIKAFQRIERVFPTDILVNDFLPLIKKFSEEKNVTARAASAFLIPIAYERFPLIRRKDLKDIFAQLAKDESTAVRKSAAGVIGTISKIAGPEAARADFLDTLYALAADPAVGVRSAAAESAVAVAGLFGGAEAGELFAVLEYNFLIDPACSVRQTAVKNAPELIKILNNTTDKHYLIEFLGTFIYVMEADTELDVRAAAIESLLAFARCLDSDYILGYIIPVIGRMAVSDPSPMVLTKIALAAPTLSTLIPKVYTYEFVTTTICHLLGESHVSVLLAILAGLPEIFPVVGAAPVAGAVMRLADSQQWRVRRAVIAILPTIVAYLDSERYKDKVAALIGCWLNDSNYSIREFVLTNIGAYKTLFGQDWIVENIVPMLLSFSTHSNYLFRVNTLYGIRSLAKVLPANVVLNTFIPIVLRMSQDSVPNIKFNVAKTLQAMVPYLDPAVIEARVIPVLEKLVKDKDPDVKYYATKCLEFSKKKTAMI